MTTRLGMVLLLWGISFAAFGQAGTINKGHVGCLTEERLDEFVTSVVNKDKRHMMALLDGGGCFFIEGRQFSMVDRGFTKSQVRIYAGGSSVVLWVLAEATK